jgi:hypothetical protein
MRRYLPFLIVLLAFTSVACPPAPKDDPPKKNGNGPAEDKPKKIDVPTDLRPRIEAAIADVQSRDLLTSHYFWTVFHGILGSGLEKTTLTYPDTKKKINAIEYICDGGEIKGMQFLPTAYGLDVMSARTIEDQGRAQGHQDQFIAEMAQWGMPKDKKFKVGGRDFTFEDFTRHAKMRASVKQMPKQELSWAIIIVAQYYGTDIPAWQNMYKETITLNEMMRYEVDEPVPTSDRDMPAACGGTHRLFGLTWAYHLHRKNGGKDEGVWKDVAAKIDTYKRLARELQNSDGSLSTDYFKSAANADDPHLRIGATGHIVEWLALAMTDEELKSPWMQEAVSRLSRMILDMGNEPIDGGALYHAAHGLALYHMRVFGTPPAFLPLPPKR